MITSVNVLTMGITVILIAVTVNVAMAVTVAPMIIPTRTIPPTPPEELLVAASFRPRAFL